MKKKTTPLNPSQKKLRFPPPDELISLQVAIREYNEYYTTRVAPLAQKTASDDSRAVWFSLPALESYLTILTERSKSKGIASPRLAFVLGADNQNKRTLFLAPMAIDPQTGVYDVYTILNDSVVFLGQDLKNIPESASASNTEGLFLGPKGYLTMAEARERYISYYDTNIQPLKDQIQDDNRILWYEQGTLEHYLAYVKQQAALQKTVISGINFVFCLKNAKVNVFYAPTALQATKTGNTHTSYVTDETNPITLDFQQPTLRTKPTLQEASLFNFFMTTVGDEKSLVGNSMYERPNDDDE